MTTFHYRGIGLMEDWVNGTQWVVNLMSHYTIIPLILSDR